MLLALLHHRLNVVLDAPDALDALNVLPTPQCSYHSPCSLDALDIPETSLLLLSSLNLFGTALHAPSSGKHTFAIDGP